MIFILILGLINENNFYNRYNGLLPQGGNVRKKPKDGAHGTVGNHWTAYTDPNATTIRGVGHRCTAIAFDVFIARLVRVSVVIVLKFVRCPLSSTARRSTSETFNLIGLLNKKNLRRKCGMINNKKNTSFGLVTPAVPRFTKTRRFHQHDRLR